MHSASELKRSAVPWWRAVLSQLQPPHLESREMVRLDLLRFIAAIVVVIEHLSGMIGVHLLPFRLSAVMVDIFFCISGYVISFLYLDRLVDRRNYLLFLKKRVARLVPLHWLTLLLASILGLLNYFHVLQANNGDFWDLPCFANNLLLIHSTGMSCPHLSFNGPSWSVSAEFLVYILVTPLAFALVKKGRRTMLLGLSLLLFGLTLFYGDNRPWFFWTADGGFFRAIPSYCMGIVIFSYRDRWPDIPMVRALPCLFGLLLLALSILPVNKAVPLPAAYALIFFVVAADRRGVPSPLVQWVARGSQLSYSSYLLHQLFLTLFITFLGGHVLHVGATGKYLLAAAAFVIVWPVSWLSFQMFERPARRYLSSRLCR